jgi:soluble lytic murein transglycosylase-like protein
MARCLIAAWLLLAASLAHADCTDRAAARFRLDADLLRAMAEQESYNRVDAHGPVLPDGNRAVGKMGINTVHLPELSTYGVKLQDLFTECGSVFVGAWIYARYLNLVGSKWPAVGIYNTGPKSKNKAAQERYIAAVRRRYDRIKRERLQRERGERAQELQRVAGTMQVWGSE